MVKSADKDDSKTYYRTISSHTREITSKISSPSKIKRVIPYPSGFSLRECEVEVTVNHKLVRSFFNNLRDKARCLKAVTLFLSGLTFYAGYQQVQPYLLLVSAFLFVVAGFKFRAVAKTETARAEATANNATVSIPEE